MIRPFGLRDLPLMFSLQRSGAALAIEHILTHPRAPVWIALTAPWPWAGFGIATYVLDAPGDGDRLTGFIQLIKRTARPEADVLHVAPAMTGADAPRDAAIWRLLLEHCVPAAASQGLQRVFVSIPDGGPEEARLRETGFSLYARESIYRLAVAPDSRDGTLNRSSPALPVGFRPQIPPDSWALQRLYTQSTPRLVQQAEGAMAGEVGSPPLSWWEPDRWVGLVWEPAGEVRGAVQAHIGRAGHWLRIWSAGGATPRERRSLVAEGLRLIAERSRDAGSAPVYVTVRDYEVGKGGILTGFGFAPYAYRTRFVRHVGAPVRSAAPVTFPGVEVGQVKA